MALYESVGILLLVVFFLACEDDLIAGWHLLLLYSTMGSVVAIFFFSGCFRTRGSDASSPDPQIAK